METFGEWLLSQRNSRKLTREEFAQRVGCSVSALRKIESGERRPSTQIAELMANCLDVPPEKRSIFVQAARGQMPVERLLIDLKPVTTSDISSPKTNLPIFPTPLIGREGEVEQLSGLLCDSTCRLLTLVGPGGMGKTRLAIETASHMQDFFADGVYFVSLASANATSFIVPMIADALGFIFQSASRTEPKFQLFNYLKAREVLLLIDNLEHLLSASGVEILSELLASAPKAKLLATSRESLELQGEWVFEVHGLPIPEREQTDITVQDTCVELFLQRARRAFVGFTPTQEDYPAIVHICQLVDGMPLGIELAAAWVRTLTCEEIAHEIEHGLDFLAVSARDVPVRHRSMRAVFDHSWKLLTEEEQYVLARMSVFRGGFRREAAEQVVGATLNVLSTLVTKSLIRRSGAGRYELHDLIRQFAAEHFSDRLQEQTTTKARHSKYYLTYFAQADGRLRSSAQREALADLTMEINNFRSAWDWAVTRGEFGLIEQTMSTFWILYDTRGWLQEGLDMLDHAIITLESVDTGSLLDRTNQVALGHILTSRAVLATRLGQQEQAEAMFERSLKILRPLYEPRVLVETISMLGLVVEFSGNYLRASEFYKEGLELATNVGDRWYAALCRLLLAGEGSLRLPKNTPENSYERLKAVVSEWRVIGDPRLTAVALQNFSWMAVKLGHYDEAREALEESVLLNTSIGDRWNLGFAYRGLGLIAQAQGEHPRAVDMFRKSLDAFIEVGTRQDEARVLVEMSRSLFSLGNDSEAERGWREALSITRETQGTFVALEALVGIAMLKMKGNHAEYALELLWIVLNHPASLPETKDRANQLRGEWNTQFSPAQVEAIQAHAERRSFDAVVEELLK